MTFFPPGPYTKYAARRGWRYGTIGNDAEIVRMVLQGDGKAYRLLVERHQAAIYSLMLRMTRSPEDAEDLAQEAFVRAYQKLDGFRLGRSFFPWLYSIARNLALDHLRRPAQREIPADPARMDETIRAGGRDPGSRLDGQAAMDAVLRLPGEYREALLLRFREDLSFPEVAQALGIGQSAAKMRVSRGLKMLRTLFDGGER